MKKYVIYTALTGGYDNLIQLSCVSPEFDYICFTDSISEKFNGIWEMRPIPNVTDDKQRLSRYPKMHPHILLPEYEYSVYIDARVDIISQGFYDIIEDKISKGIMLSGVRHPDRDCVYEEFFAVYHLRKETNLGLLKKEYKFLRDNNFPDHIGLFEAGLILRKHNDASIIAQNETWWQLVNTYSKRDQLSYTYTLWKNGIPFDYLENVGLNKENDYCKLTVHPGLWRNMPFFKRIRRRVYNRFIRGYVPLIKPIFYYYLSF